MVLVDESVFVEYEINPFTMIIFPYEYGNKTYSRVIEYENELLSPFKPTELIKKGCEYNFTDFNTSRKVACRLTRIAHKAPIAIDPINSVYLMPTKSPNKADCIWVSYEHLVDHKRNDAYSTIVKFRNNQTFILPISYRSFDNQFLRTSELKNKITEKMKENERKALYIHRRRYSEESIHSMVSERYR